MSSAQNRRDWEEFIILCGRDRCSRCKTKDVPIYQHHKEPLEPGNSRFSKEQPITIDRFYELIVECEPLCAKCHRNLHYDMECCDDEKIRSTWFQKERDFTKELIGELPWSEVEPEEGSSWDTVGTAK